MSDGQTGQTGQAGQGEAAALFEFVPLSERGALAPDAAGQAIRRWQSLRRLLGLEQPEPDPVVPEAQLHRLSDQSLDALLRPVDWSLAAAALAASLADWRTRASGEHDWLRIVVAPPYGGLEATLQWYAVRYGAELLAAPDPQAILGGRAGLPVRAGDADRRREPCVIAQLGHWFLRHADGLSLVRELMAGARRGEFGRVLIGCDGWAYAYLRRVCHLPEHCTLALQPFDGERLGRLLAPLLGDDGNGAPMRLRMRNARSGRDVLVVDRRATVAAGGGDGDAGHGEGEGPQPTSVQTGYELTTLAARCRGDPGLAWHLVRRQIRVESEAPRAEGEGDNAATGAPAEASEAQEERIVWLAATPDEPGLPNEARDDLALVCHALLVHEGLPEALLARLLPFPPHAVASVVDRLYALGAVGDAAADGRLRVSAQALAPVRDFLRGRGFQVNLP